MGLGPQRTKLPENVVEIPLTKERLVFTGVAPDGSHVAFDMFLGPGGGVPDVHKHAGQVEVFHCVRGELTIVVEGERRVLRAGETLELPPDTFHSLANEGPDEVECRVEYRPARKSEQWLKLVGASVRWHGRDVGLLDIAPFINDVGFYIQGPPVWAQRALFTVLKPLAVLLGRRRRMLDIAERTYGKAFSW